MQKNLLTFVFAVRGNGLGEQSALKEGAEECSLVPTLLLKS
jgi:hypothetical protein